MQRKKSIFQNNLVTLFLVLLVGIFLGCSEDESEGLKQVSSRAYKGHENDMDANNLVSMYPSILGTRLDDCHTCHTGEVKDGKVASNACDNCHNLMLHGEEVGSHTFTETLNPFGLDYLNAGRNSEALKSIKDKDSDGDGFKNDEEILALRYPGSNLSKPGQAVATLRTVSVDELKAMPSHSQFMLANTSKQQFDDYATFKGVKIKDLLASLGINLAGATGITVIAPDGFMNSVPIETVDKVFPQPMFSSGLDVDTLGQDGGFVNYPKEMPQGLSNGAPIAGEHWLMMAYERDGMPMEPSYLDAAAGKITGEGPLRLVVPQAKAGKPDRGLKYSPTNCNDGYDYDENADHNAGAMVRGVIAIRIDLMPAGVEEFDYMNGGWAYINTNQLIIYGHNVQ
ncbi:hypothetical protein FJZ31_39790 [Candidatus Poribacteria bacterium]|nr:hypothetical protein [Candidatus Poribacteria bacterium]